MRVLITVIRGPHQGQGFNFTDHDTFLVGLVSQCLNASAQRSHARSSSPIPYPAPRANLARHVKPLPLQTARSLHPSVQR